MTETRNVELVRLGFEMFEREGTAAFRSLLDLADPQIECYAAPGVEPSGRHEGREAALRWWEEWFEAWDDFQIKPTTFIEERQGVVVVPLHQVARGKESGIEVAVDVAFVFEIRNGRITRFHIYPDTDQALTAAATMGVPP